MHDHTRSSMTLCLLALATTLHAQAPRNPKPIRPLAELAAEQRTRPLTHLTAEEHQIFIYERETLRGIRAGDIDRMMDLFIGANAIVCPPGTEAIIGRDNQKVLFKQWLGTKGVELDYEPIDVRVGPSGEMAYAHGLVRWRSPGEPRFLGKYISVWVKEKGRWMNHVEMRNVVRSDDPSQPNATPRIPTSSKTRSMSVAELAAERRTRALTALSPAEHQVFIYERETLHEIRAGNVDGAMNLFIGRDAMVCPPGGDAIFGRERQKVLFRRWLGTKGVELDYEPIDVHVTPSGNMAYVYGIVRWKNPGQRRVLGKYVSVWIREDGRWLNQVEMRNAIHVESDG